KSTVIYTSRVASRWTTSGCWPKNLASESRSTGTRRGRAWTITTGLLTTCQRRSKRSSAVGEENSKRARRIVGRRELIGLGLGSAAALFIPGVASARIRVIRKQPPRALSFYNLHTGESLKVTYFEHGRYVPGAMREIDFILRDWRQNEVKQIDPALL